MILTYQFEYRGEHLNYILDQCKVSRCLYNQALYEIKQEMKNGLKISSAFDLDKKMKNKLNLEGECNYKLLRAQVSQQCLRQLEHNIKGYKNAYKDWKIHPYKYKSQPRPPKYIKKYNMLTYVQPSISRLNKGYLLLNKKHAIKIPQFEKYKDDLLIGIKLFQIIPYDDYVKIIIVYEKKEEEKSKSDNVAMIDLGVKNLLTEVSSDGTSKIYNGRKFNSILQRGHKTLAYYKSKLKKINNKYTSKRTKKLQDKQNKRIKHSLHTISKRVVDNLKSKNIGVLAVGYNKNWKQKVNLGTRTNQAFTSIPHKTLIDMLKYKCELAGIEFILHEESYTSKCDALAFEPIEKQDSYKGKRIKRGLFQSSTGRLINADVNGALNIGRKVFGDDRIKDLIDSGFGFNPVRCNVL